jgi:hypothetical protein
VLERQLILDVARKDYGAAGVDLSQAKSTWESVKASAAGHDGQEVVAQFDASLAAQESALAAKEDAALTDEARNALEIVDALERLY